MKELSELNSKWYWRFIKVIGVIIYVIIFSFSIAGVWLAFSHYDPVKLEKAKNIIITSYKVTPQLEKIKNEIPGENFTLKDFKKIINQKYLNNVDTIAINFVMLEYLGKKSNQLQICGRDLKWGCSGDPVGTYIEDSINSQEYDFVITISNDTYEDAKSAFNDFLNAENKAMSEILDLINKKTDWVSYDAFSDFERLYEINLDIGSEYDYRSIIDYFKIIVSGLGILLGIFIFNFILLRIIYYIILGKFFPKESE